MLRGGDNTGEAREGPDFRGLYSPGREEPKKAEKLLSNKQDQVCILEQNTLVSHQEEGRAGEENC